MPGFQPQRGDREIVDVGRQELLFEAALFFDRLFLFFEIALVFELHDCGGQRLARTLEGQKSRDVLRRNGGPSCKLSEGERFLRHGFSSLFEHGFRLGARQHAGRKSHDALYHLAFFLCAAHPLLRGETRRIALCGEAHIRIVLTEFYAVFRPRGHHAVGFVRTLGDEVVDEDADVRLVAGKHHLFPSFQPQRGVEPRHEPLRRRLLVAAAPVELTRKVQPGEEFAFQRGVKGGGVNAVVLYRVGVFRESAPREPGDGAVHRLLHVMRQRTAHALDVHLVAPEPFGFDEYLMPLLVPEPHDLVLYGGAVAGTYAAYAPVVERGTGDVLHDDRVRALVGVGEPAGLFRKAPDLGHKGEPVRIFAELYLHLVKVYGIAVYARGRARLEPPHGEPELQKAVREPDRGGVP